MIAFARTENIAILSGIALIWTDNNIHCIYKRGKSLCLYVLGAEEEGKTRGEAKADKD